jgi:hypothetical protein
MTFGHKHLSIVVVANRCREVGDTDSTSLATFKTLARNGLQISLQHSASVMPMMISCTQFIKTLRAAWILLQKHVRELNGRPTFWSQSPEPAIPKCLNSIITNSEQHAQFLYMQRQRNSLLMPVYALTVLMTLRLQWRPKQNRCATHKQRTARFLPREQLHSPPHGACTQAKALRRLDKVRVQKMRRVQRTHGPFVAAGTSASSVAGAA